MDNLNPKQGLNNFLRNSSKYVPFFSNSLESVSQNSVACRRLDLRQILVEQENGKVHFLSTKSFHASRKTPFYFCTSNGTLFCSAVHILILCHGSHLSSPVAVPPLVNTTIVDGLSRGSAEIFLRF